MKTKQVIFLNSLGTNNERNAQIEMSVLAGKKTRFLPEHLSKDAIQTIHAAFSEFDFAFTKWSIIYAKLSLETFEPLVENIPEPNENEGKLYDLPLENGGIAKLFVHVTQLVGNGLKFRK